MAKTASKESGVPMMMTQDMERRLRDSGLDQSAIDKMKPQDAHSVLDKLGLANDDEEDDASTRRVNEKQAERVRHLRHRSPNYPFINLEKAIERTRQIYEADRRHDVPIKVVNEKRWEYKPGSSQGDQTLAALRAFGLVEITGAGDKRMVRISEHGYRILAGATDASERIKDAALSPTLHGELWQKYGRDGLPSSDVIRNYLLFEREAGRFNEDVVDAFIDRFKETISFAKLDSSDKIRAAVLGGLDDDQSGEQDGGQVIQNASQAQQRQNPAPPPPASGQKDFPLYLSNNKRGGLNVPGVMTLKEFELLKRQIENHLAVIEATSVAEDKLS
jgi:hypothetical protein